MHLTTILAFVFLFWRAEQPAPWLLVDHGSIGKTLLIVLGQPLLIAGAAILAGRRARKLLAGRAVASHRAHQSHHRAVLLLRLGTLLGFGVTIFLTPWPDWFAWGRSTPPLQIVGDAIVLAPFVMGILALWIGAFPLERALRRRWIDEPVTSRDKPGADVERDARAEAITGRPHPDSPSEVPSDALSLRAYLDFNLRHQVLVIAAPMMLILFVADLTRGYEEALQVWTGRAWTPDLLLGLSVVIVLLLAPLLLRRIWHTAPLGAGAVRHRLEAICRRIGLRCRDILIWNSDGIMINAAVMGVFAPVRYVLLSDALLHTMSERQIEAVFGHEAGHVRLHHMQHFLVFALVGWLVVCGLMELLAQTTVDAASSGGWSPLTIQGIGFLATAVFWGLGFGWLSRRFEREADVFATRCVTPEAQDCTLPCSVHLERTNPHGHAERVCATGAAIFASALDRVAVLNGIPHEERSWRHSSIGSRIRFLTSLAGDPGRAARFQRLLRRVRIFMVVAAVIGSALWAYYWITVPEPAIVKLQLGSR